MPRDHIIILTVTSTIWLILGLKFSWSQGYSFCSWSMITIRSIPHHGCKSDFSGLCKCLQFFYHLLFQYFKPSLYLIHYKLTFQRRNAYYYPP